MVVKIIYYIPGGTFPSGNPDAGMTGESETEAYLAITRMEYPPDFRNSLCR